MFPIFLLIFVFFNNTCCWGNNMENLLFNPVKDERYTLDNGLVVLLKQSKRLPLVSIQTWVKVGSIYEDDKNNGISHFLEHLVFKGTKKYSVEQISKTLERYGAILNAGTSKEFTLYFTDIPKEGLNDALDVLAQLVFEATFPEEELERERNVVIEEIKRFEDNPGNVLYEGFNNLLFKDSPYKRRILGTQEVIRNLSRDEIIKYYKKFYHPKNMILSICGDFEIEEVKNLIKQKFGSYNSDKQTNQLLTLDESSKGEIFEIKKHKVQHTYFLCGFLGPKIDEKHQYTGDVLSIILGEGISSRLYKILREEKMLVYEIDSGFYTQLGPSVFYISGVCERKNLEKVISEVKSILNELKEKGPNSEEIEKAKRIITTRWYLNNETMHSKASSLAWWEMFKSLEELNKYLENINKVSSNDVKEFLSIYYKSLISFALVP